MEEIYTIKVTSQAEEQMQEIIHYITYELKAPNAALHLLDALEDSFVSLTHFPQRIALVDEEPWRSNGIHRFTIKNFLVYFWIEYNFSPSISLEGYYSLYLYYAYSPK